MLILTSPQLTQETVGKWKKDSKIALVPTMGCLHSGHITLVRRAKQLAERVIVSIFVNPLQFGPNEDFDRYPRTFENDCALLEKEGVDAVFHPSVTELYPPGFSANVSMGKITERLCGKFRPGHFDGVATVCLKLFQITQCDFGVFGEKDFQQLRIIQNMVRDLNLPISIASVATVREEDGLALSSRNRYLTPELRKEAAIISEILFSARERVHGDATIRVLDILADAKDRLQNTSLKSQYIEITTGSELEKATENALVNALPMPHLFLAVYAGTTRLIDNISLNGIHA